MAPPLIEVAFKGNRKEFFLWDGEGLPPLKAPVIVDADRGEDLGHVHAVGELASTRNAGAAHGSGEAGPSKHARRLATTDDERRWRELRDQDEDTRRKAMDRVKANQLVMKLSDAEWQWDRKKLTIYFTADKRVDFRNLVRELAAMFRTRIELKQIGVRDEAKRLDGIGRCGRQYCSSSWLPELRPVNLGVAKDQRLSLNPSQISGACGRLMCCLRYEHDFYVQQRRRFPKEGKVLVTRRGEEKVISNDIFRERVTLRSVEGEIRAVPLIDLQLELEGAAGAVPLTVDDTPSRGTDSESEYEGSLEEEGASRERSARAPRRPERAQRPERQPPSAPPAAAAPAAPTVAAPSEAEDPDGPSDDSDDSGDEQRKPHRRRGRRGGRRNRPRSSEDGGSGGSGGPGGST